MASTLLLEADSLLRAGPTREAPWRWRLAVLVAFGAFYGAVMGSYSQTGGVRPLQMVYSALKVPLMLTASFALSLPTFFVVNTLLGLRGDFPKVIAALTTTQAGLTVILASLAPITGFIYVSGLDYRKAVLLNGLMFAAASFGAQAILRRSYRDLIAARPIHRQALRAWLIVYVFVGVQMGWILRPFIGDPFQPTQFFRQEGFSNAYVAVAQMVWSVFSRG